MNRTLKLVHDRCDEVGECWIWRQATTSKGYPRLNLGSVQGYAHKIAWESVNGPVPQGRVMHRTCNNLLCCNPEHCKPITRAMQNRLAAARGAWSGPERCMRIAATAQRLRGKLTMEQARAIRLRTESIDVLAAEFGVNRTVIANVRRNESYREVAAGASVFSMARAA